MEYGKLWSVNMENTQKSWMPLTIGHALRLDGGVTSS